ncbi:FAD/NAD(P)-binding domain-containing protein [Zopfia rhizophila CBS 207.26]|uniref:FAD/NAD(P)-binding domain-containing protein n=1 Tax=Zopfia rhizophila CBS 207.26 TaxID=1314779 RepID=A0A6A6EPJ8_9PEZI|nr:FAD/NAD(P)-binding domain-containing protein [Zopfia rhizophila CBS 207.26]
MAPSEQTPFKVIILGAGLAGSLLANGLIHHGIPFECYERMQRDEKHEGYQIRLGAPALIGMRACLSEQQKTAIIAKFGRAGGKKSTAPMIYHKDFSVLLDMSAFPDYSKSAAINRKVLRDSLAEPVFEVGRLQYGKEFERYEIVGSGAQEKVCVWFRDGTSDECDLLISAEGSRSRANEQVGLDNISTVESHVGFATKRDLPTEQIAALPRALLLYLPDGVEESIAAPSQSEDTPEMDNAVTSVYFSFWAPSSIVPSNMKELPINAQWDFITSAIRNWDKAYHEIISVLCGSPIHVYSPRVASRPPTNWRSRVQSRSAPEKGHPRVWLMGDAIHAMLPNRGMGGNQSMQDAAVVVQHLTALADAARASHQPPSHEEIAAACASYEAEMLPRTFAWVRKSGGQRIIVRNLTFLVPLQCT